MEAIASDGRLEVVPWHSFADSRGLRLATRLDRAAGLRHFIPGPMARRHAARETRRIGRERRCAAILHMGTYDIGWRRSPLTDYFYTDNTYDLWERQANAARQLSSWTRRCFRFLENRSLRNVCHAFTTGEHVARNLTQTYGLPPERITAVGTGLGGIEPYHGPKDYTRPELLIVAKVRPHDKGLPLLLAAVELMRKRLPAVHLTVMGGATYPDVQAAQNVTGTGWIEFEQVQRIYENATLFVMPATYEPWGLSYIEALACRAPIVGLNHNAFPEISGNGRFGFMLTDVSAEGLAKLLLDALADPARLEQMGRAGQEYCLQRYDWGKIGQKIADRICADLAPSR